MMRGFCTRLVGWGYVFMLENDMNLFEYDGVFCVYSVCIVVRYLLERSSRRCIGMFSVVILGFR